MNLQVAGIEKESIVDGNGVRYVIFVQGCSHNCKGCHNPSTHNYNGGTTMNTYDLIKDIKSNLSIIDGVTFSGGEPFDQPLPLIELAKDIHNIGLDIVCYTGYTIERLILLGNNNQKELLNNIDYLVDGPFVLSKKSLSLKYRGSSNQRYIDIKATKQNGNLITIFNI